MPPAEKAIGKLTGRERIERAFRFELSDHVACFEQLVYSTVASDLMGRTMHTGGGCLQRAYAEAWLEGGEAAWRELSRRVFEDIVALHRELGFDMVRPVSETAIRPTRKMDERSYVVENADGTATRHVFNEASQTFTTWQEETPSLDDVRRQVESLEDALPDYSPRIEDYAIYQRYAEALPDLAMCASGVTMAIPMRSPYLELTALEPELIERYIEVQTEMILKRIPLLKQAGATVALGGGDLASGKGPVYSPATFRRIMLPRFRRIVEACREQGMPYIFRTDGWLWPLMDMIFGEIGSEGYGEIDAAAGMDLGEVRAKFPNLVFWGNVPCGTLLIHGTPEQVRGFARECVEKTGGGRGLILGSSNCLAHGTPAENVLAMLEARDL